MSNITINTDKTLSINGVKTFPVFIYGGLYCYPNDCDPENTQDYIFWTQAWADKWPTDYYIFNEIMPKFASNRMFLPAPFPRPNDTDIYSLTDASINSDYFFGYYIQTDEPDHWDVPASTLVNRIYILDKLENNKLFYMDRIYKATSVPFTYLGLDYIQTADNDRFEAGTAFLQFDIGQPATVYVAYDDRISPKPSWLTSSFIDTSSNILRDGTYTYSIYSKAYPVGHVSLGGCSIPSGGAGGMYMVIVKG